MSVYFLDWIVGAHTPFTNQSIHDTVKIGINYGMSAIQFFMGSPQGFTRAKITEKDIQETLALIDRFPIKIFSHFPYVANFCGSVKQLAWKGDTEQDAKTTKCIKGLEYELSILAKVNGGVVIHPGNYKDEKEGMNTIIESINKIKFTKGSLLLLENAAGQGVSLARNFRQISYIIEGIHSKENIGVCLDTCHFFAVGEYDISQVSELKKALKDFDEIIGLKYLKLIHLNDSEDCLASHKDNHACIGAGNIWGDNFDSLVYLLNFCKERDIPAVLETHGLDMITLSCIEESCRKIVEENKNKLN